MGARWRSDDHRKNPVRTPASFASNCSPVLQWVTALSMMMAVFLNPFTGYCPRSSWHVLQIRKSSDLSDPDRVVEEDEQRRQNHSNTLRFAPVVEHHSTNTLETSWLLWNKRKFPSRHFLSNWPLLLQDVRMKSKKTFKNISYVAKLFPNARSSGCYVYSNTNGRCHMCKKLVPVNGRISVAATNWNYL